MQHKKQNIIKLKICSSSDDDVGIEVEWGEKDNFPSLSNKMF